MEHDYIKKIKLGDINPFIRVIRTHTINPFFKSEMRYIRHYQFHYIVDGIGYFHIDGKNYSVEKGGLCFWSPGQLHSISTHSSPVEVIGVQFDLTRNFSHLDYLPIPYNSKNFKTRYINEIIKFKDFIGYPPFIKFKNHALIKDMLSKAENYYNNEFIFAEEKSSAKIKEFLLLAADRSTSKDSQSYNNRKFHSLLEYIKNNYHEQLTNKDIALKFGYHPVYLNRIILRLVGMPLHQYMIKLRIEQAIHLLQTTDLPIGHISNDIGYNNQQYFSRLFKKKTNYTPSSFRK